MGNCSKKKNAVVITPVLAAGSVASPYFVQVNLSKKLCRKVCMNEVPVFAPVYSFKSLSNVGDDQYVVTVHVEGAISYNPCSGCACSAGTEVVSQDFTIPLYAATAPTSVTIAAGASVNAINPDGCEDCSKNFTSETTLTITVA